METTGPTSRYIQRIYINIKVNVDKIMMHASKYLIPNLFFLTGYVKVGFSQESSSPLV